MLELAPRDQHQRVVVVRPFGGWDDVDRHASARGQQMAHQTPDEREQLADGIAQAMKDASPEDRKVFQEGFGVGFFPPDVVESVRAKLR